MKILIAGSKSKFFHLEEFGEALTKFDVEYMLVHDIDIQDGFPSRNITNWFQSRAKFNCLIKDFGPDAIFVDRQRHFSLAAVESGIPTYMLLRGDYWSEIEWAKQTLYRTPARRIALYQWNKIAEKCFEKATMIMPICRYLDNVVKEHYPQKKTEVLYGGIDASRWHTVEGMKLDHPCVGLLQGAWIWGKTQEILTLENVIKSLPDITFYWAGDGPYRQKITDVLDKYKNFKWLGNLQYPDQVREYIASLDVYALPSGIDMSPLTLQEAQLMKKPVIATNAGGIPELMKDGETGFLVQKGDYNTWIEKIKLLLNDKTLAQRFGENGRQFVEREFSWEKMAKNFVRIVESHMAKD